GDRARRADRPLLDEGVEEDAARLLQPGRRGVGAPARARAPACVGDLTPPEAAAFFWHEAATVPDAPGGARRRRPPLPGRPGRAGRRRRLLAGDDAGGAPGLCRPAPPDEPPGMAASDRRAKGARRAPGGGSPAGAGRGRPRAVRAARGASRPGALAGGPAATGKAAGSGDAAVRGRPRLRRDWTSDRMLRGRGAPERAR